MDNNKYEQFLLEKELAEKLRNTTIDERKTAYKDLYGEFFTKFPKVSYDNEKDIAHTLAWQVELLKPILKTEHTFMEIGAGNCLLSIEVAKNVKKVIAYEVADSIPHIENAPQNVVLKIFDGVDFPEADNSVDIIYSNQVFEHLHPDDAVHHTNQYYKMLNNGGKVIIVTPHALTGPHDVSREYSKKPEGFHMREYTYNGLKKILKSAGFKNIKVFVGYKKTGYLSLNILPFLAFEKIYGLVPLSLRYKFKKSIYLKSVFGIKIVGEK